jgi:hypothetical protein
MDDAIQSLREEIRMAEVSGPGAIVTLSLGNAKSLLATIATLNRMLGRHITAVKLVGEIVAQGEPVTELTLEWRRESKPGGANGSRLAMNTRSPGAATSRVAPGTGQRSGQGVVGIAAPLVGIAIAIMALLVSAWLWGRQTEYWSLVDSHCETIYVVDRSGEIQKLRRYRSIMTSSTWFPVSDGCPMPPEAKQISRDQAAQLLGDQARLLDYRSPP